MPAKNRIEVSTAAGVGAQVTPPQVLDYAQNPLSVFLDAIVTGTVSYTIQATTDDVFNPSYVPGSGNWFTVPGAGTPQTPMTAQTGAYQTSLGPAPVTAVRINQASGTGTVTLRILQGGRRTA